MHLCKEKYKLELRWDSIEYHDDTTARLHNARLVGPALKIASKIASPDMIKLDLTPQLLALLDTYYVIRLSWDTVDYLSNGSVTLGGAVLNNTYLKTLHKLDDSDYIAINTEQHEEENHPYQLLYESEVIRKDNEPYVYRS